jgi:hypothetical protein
MGKRKAINVIHKFLLCFGTFMVLMSETKSVQHIYRPSLHQRFTMHSVEQTLQLIFFLSCYLLLQKVTRGLLISVTVLQIQLAASTMIIIWQDINQTASATNLVTESSAASQK